ncbi:MAK10-like protein [Tanacetum coccineum]
MGDENPIRTLGDYSKPSHEGYRNTIELPVGKNVVPLRSDAIRLVQNGCSFHGLRSDDPNQHLKDFLKLVDSLDLDASNWLERLPEGSIITREDLTTRFLAQFFPPGRTAKLCNDILMFQQHHGESLSEAWTRFKDLLQKVPHHGIKLWLKDLALYDNESWNNPRDFAKPVKAIALPQDAPSTSDCRLIELENQVQRLMEAHLAPTQPTQVNKVTTSCEICSGPQDTQYCMEDPEQAFVEYASSRTDEAGGLVSNLMASQDVRRSKFEADFKQQQSEMTNKIDIVLKAITDRIAGTLPSETVKNPKLSTHPVLSACSYLTMDPQCSTHVHGSINAVTIHPKQHNDSRASMAEEEEKEREGNPVDTNTVAYWDDGEVMFIELNRKNDDSSEGEPKEEGSITTEGNNEGENFVGLGRDMHVFVGNMSYVIDFTILENIETNIDPSLSHVIFGRPFIEIACLAINRKHELMTFTDGTKEVTFKTPYKDPERSKLSSEGHDLIPSRVILSKDDYDRGCRKPSNLEDGFYRDTIKLGPEYATGIDDEGEVT